MPTAQCRRAPKHPYNIMPKTFTKGLLGLFTFLAPLSMSAQTADFDIIPKPKEVILASQQPFLLNAGTRISYPKKDKMLKEHAVLLAQYIKEATGLELDITHKPSEDNVITLSTSLKSENPEAYQIAVNPEGIKIEGASAAGTFYGMQTLRKALPVLSGKITEVNIPSVQVKDEPRFAYRGAHLDVSRHFITPDSVCRYIDMLALHNINRFHWHLTDDQGWRIEIKKYPKLTTVGAYRPETLIGRDGNRYDGTPHKGFYTQKDIKEILEYARLRHITIIPEIDLPGHMQAALAAYPELGCTGGPYEVRKIWGISDDVLCAGNDLTLQFIDDVLDEVVALFPSEYIHVGGDECPKIRWKNCPKCQERIKNEQLQADAKHSAEERLQSYVIRHAEKHLNSLGRQMIGWDETLEGGLAPNATVMSWRGEGGGIEAASQHHKVIMTPNTYLYLDYYQTKDVDNEPLAIGGYLPVETVYSYEPISKRITPEQAQYIIGVQANIWTEYMPTFRQVEYMALPRFAALSEIQWSQPKYKNYGDFCKRLPKFMGLYKQLGYNYAKHIYDITPEFSTDTAKRQLQVKMNTIDNATIYYTLDGSRPTANSLRYSEPVQISQPCQIQAVAIRHDETSHLMSETFHFNKATATPIQALQPINSSYFFNGATTLVDGLIGTDTNFKTGRWIGFYRNDMEMVIDLGSATPIKSVGFNTCVEKGAWIFDARGVEIAVSDDGQTFKPVFKKDILPMKENDRNGIYHHEYAITPCNARFVKVKALSEQSIPQWHGGKGHPGFLFVDEIIVK